MPKLVTALLAIGATLVAAVMVVPGFVDWNHFKPEIIAQASKTTGRIVSIDGAVDLSVLPMPTISVGGVRVANIEPSDAPDMISLASLDMRIALLPLLYGEIQVLSVRMVEPVIRLERFADGSVNWVFGAESGPIPQGNRAGEREVPIALDNVEIVGGRVTYSDAASGVTATVDSIDARLSAPTLSGPFTGMGRGRYRDMPVEVQARIGELVDDGPVPVRVDLTSAGSNAIFAGSVGNEAENGDKVTTGSVQLRGDRMRTLLQALRGTGVEVFVPAALTDKPYELGGRVTLAPQAAQVDKFKIELGDARGEGRFTLDLSETPRFDIAFAFNRLDLDALLATEDLAPVAGPRTGPRDQDAAIVEIPEPLADGATGLADWTIPRDLNGTVDVKVDALLFRRQIVRQAVLNAGVVGGTFNIQRLSALLPGGSDVTTFGSVMSTDAGPRFSGRVEATSDNLRALLDWLSLGIDAVPADRLRKLSLAADVDGGPGEGQITNIDLLLDSSRLNGGIAYVMRTHPAFGVNLRLDRINLDGYLPPGPALATPAPTPASDAETDGGLSPLAEILAPLAAFDADFVTRVDQLTYRGVPINEIVVDGLLQSGTLTLREARVADMAGARAGFSGTLTDIGEEVTVSGQVSFDSQELAALSRLMPVIDDLPRALTGPLRLESAANGTLDRLTVDGAIDALDGRFSVKGIVSELSDAPSMDVALDATHPNLAQLLAAFGTVDAEAAPALIAAPVAVNATIVGGSVGLDVDAMGSLSGGDISVTGNLDLFKPEPRFDLTGRADHPDLARVLAAATGLDPSSIPDAMAGPAALEAELLGAVTGFDLVSGLTIGDTVLGVEGRVDDADNGLSYTLDLNLENPSFAAFADALGAAPSPPPGAGPLAITGRVVGTPSVIDLPNLSITLGAGTAVAKGSVALAGARPRIKAALVADELVASHWMALSAVRPAADDGPSDLSGLSDPAPESQGWSRTPIDLAALGSVDVDLEVTADRLLVADQVIGAADAAVTVTGGVATLSRLTGTLFEGELSADGRLDGRDRPSFRVNAKLLGADSAQVLTVLAGAAPVHGRVDIDAKMSARGASPADMIASLNGTATVAGVGSGEIIGLDLAGLSEALGGGEADTALDAARTALSDGTTRFANIEGRIDILNGIARTDDLRMEIAGGEAAVAGTVDLQGWTQDLATRVSFTDHADAPPIGVRLTGRLDAPEREIEIDAVDRYLAARALADTPSAVTPGGASPGGNVIEGLIRGAGGTEQQRNMLQELLGALPEGAEDDAPEAAMGVPEAQGDADIAEDPAEPVVIESAAVVPAEAEPVISAPAPIIELGATPAPDPDESVDAPLTGDAADEPATMEPPPAAPAPVATPEPASAALAPEPAPEPATPAEQFDTILEDLLGEP